MRYSLLYFILMALVVGVGAGLTGCGGCGDESASVQGRIASAEGFGQAQNTLEQALRSESDFGQHWHALSLDGISVELFQRIDDVEELNELIDEGAEHAPDMGDGRWILVDSREPEPDGSFAFPDLEPGHYSLQLDQPEFGGVAYGADGTDFHLMPGQSVSLVLPLVSNITVDAPGLLMGDRGDDIDAFRSADTAIIDEDSGLIIGGGQSLWVLDPDNETLHSLLSDHLFAFTGEDYHLVTYSPGLNEAFLIFANRIVAVDLSLFDDVDPGQALDYDDPEVREAIGDKVRWRFIDETMTEQMSAVRWGPINRRHALNWFFSADDSLLYVTVSHGTHGFEQRTMIMETDTLSVRRMIFGKVTAYNAHIDQLVLSYDGVITLVDASAMRDVAEVMMHSNLGITPVPDSGDYIFAYSQLAADDREVPFIAVVDQEGEILSDQRASEFLGIDYDPDPGAPWFDSTGDFFMLGTQGFRILGDGEYDDLGHTVPQGQLFNERVDCNYHRIFDPVNRYEIWFDCDGWQGHPGAMAIISTDRGNIPISIRANSANVLLHPPSGRAFVLDDNLSLSVVHYADPLAAQRSAYTDIVTGQEHREPGQECSADEPCPFEQVCIGQTDTAWTGTCHENRRTPFLRWCGGLTGVECDEGFSCELQNPTNPDSIGACVGCPNRDYEEQGPLCSPEGDCLTGFSCNAQGRCVPLACKDDADCDDGDVCGMVSDVGRVCITPGPLDKGEICDGPEQCQSGVCVYPLLESGPTGLCTTLCAKNDDCSEDSQCHHLVTPWPVCVHEEWAGAGYRPHDDCADCDDNSICTDRGGERCQTGFFPGPLSCEPAIGVGCSSDQDCALPGSCIQFEPMRDDGPLWDDQQICGFTCAQNADCPWDADCINGTCSVTWKYWNDDAYFCEDGQGCDDDQWCLGLQFPSDPFHCVDESPCYYSDECADGLECYGICSRQCDPWEQEPCDEGRQCVWDGDSFFGPICTPPICDCPDTQGPPASCRLDTHDCSFRQNCTVALCDGTFGPADPDDPEGNTCCRPGNPCDLSQEELCQCPPTCDFWRQDYCCNEGDQCPSSTNPATFCPDNYQCQLVDSGATNHQTYGFFCVAADD